jgi:predicted metal-dependent hydrolase
LERITHPELGTIEVKVNARSKRIKIYRSSPEGWRLVLPHISYLQQGRDFIDKMQDKLVALAPQQGANLIKQGPVDHLGWTVEFIDNPASKVASLRAAYSPKESAIGGRKGLIKIMLPSTLSWDSADAQELAKKGLIFAATKKAKTEILKRIVDLAAEYKLPFNKARIGSAKTLWGSCSSRKNINLSFRLSFLPPELIDYVLLHELCHTVHMNHGTDFWNLMAKLMPDYAQRMDEIKKLKIPAL